MVTRRNFGLSPTSRRFVRSLVDRGGEALLLRGLRSHQSRDGVSGPQRHAAQSGAVHHDVPQERVPGPVPDLLRQRVRIWGLPGRRPGLCAPERRGRSRTNARSPPSATPTCAVCPWRVALQLALLQIRRERREPERERRWLRPVGQARPGYGRWRSRAAASRPPRTPSRAVTPTPPRRAGGLRGARRHQAKTKGT